MSTKSRPWDTVDEGYWGDILEVVDPDWKDHWIWPEHGLECYFDNGMSAEIAEAIAEICPQETEGEQQ